MHYLLILAKKLKCIRGYSTFFSEKGMQFQFSLKCRYCQDFPGIGKKRKRSSPSHKNKRRPMETGQSSMGTMA